MADAFRFNNLGTINLIHEATFGTPGAVAHQVPLVSRTFGAMDEKGTTKRRPSSFNPVATPRGLYKAEGNIVSVADEKFIGLMFHKLFGAATVTGTTPNYNHVWKIGSTDPGSMTVEEYDTGNSIGDQTNGVKCIGFEIVMKKESTELEISWDLLGLGKRTRNGAAIDASPTTYNNSAFNLTECSAKVDTVATTLVTEARLSAKRFASNPMVVNGQRYGQYINLGGWTFDLSITGLWTHGVDDMRLLQTGEAEHAFEMIFSMPTGTHSLSLNMQEMNCFVDAIPALGDTEGERMITVTGAPHYIDGAGASALITTLITDVAVYATAWTT